MGVLDLSSAGLPLDLALRIGAHAGPVVPAQDPVRRAERNFYGPRHVDGARAAHARG